MPYGSPADAGSTAAPRLNLPRSHGAAEEPRSQESSVSPSIPANVQIGRGRFVGLVTAVAGVAAAATWILVAVAFDNGSSTAAPIAQANTAGSVSSAARDARRVPSIMSLSPAQLAGGALGTGYALPSTQHGPTTASVLASMSPQTRTYTKAIMGLTFAQLAGGAAGQP